MDPRTGTITIAAVLGTGLATLGFAVGGVSALGDDLQAAARTAPAPAVLSPSEERQETVPSTTPGAAGALELEDVCDRSERGGAGTGDGATTPDAAAKEY